ncbi:MAG: glycosyltransferase family 4 protein [Prevotella sp.]
MRIGFDAKRAAQNRTGLGNYSRFVIRILQQHFPEDEQYLYLPNPKKTKFLPTSESGNRKKLFPKGFWTCMRSIWRVWGINKDIKRDEIEIFHGLSNELPLNIKSTRCPSVVTIHDLIFIHCPKYYHWIDRKIYDYKFRRACRNADRVIAVSEYTKREIMHYYGTGAEKIDVVYQGCDPAFSAPIAKEKLEDVSSRYNLPHRFVLYVGSIEERKNLMLVARAMKRGEKGEGRGERNMDFSVVAVGKRTAYTDEIVSYLEENGIRGRFLFLHDVSFADLPSFYRLATAFVYPSRIEGFGIPLLEAISSGLPAIGCTGSCLEEAGGPGSIYVNPDDEEAMADALCSVMNDEEKRQKMIAAGLDYSKNFSDENLALQLHNVYEKLKPNKYII